MGWVWVGQYEVCEGLCARGVGEERGRGGGGRGSRGGAEGGRRREGRGDRSRGQSSSSRILPFLSTANGTTMNPLILPDTGHDIHVHIPHDPFLGRSPTPTWILYHFQSSSPFRAQDQNRSIAQTQHHPRPRDPPFPPPLPPRQTPHPHPTPLLFPQHLRLLPTHTLNLNSTLTVTLSLIHSPHPTRPPPARPHLFLQSLRRRPRLPRSPIRNPRPIPHRRPSSLGSHPTRSLTSCFPPIPSWRSQRVREAPAEWEGL